VKSVVDACDEFIISEGYSEDGTDVIVRSLASEFLGKIKVIHEAWGK